MPETTRCKLRCSAVTIMEGECCFEVNLQAQYDEALSKEDRAFSKSTPSATMKAMITNPAVKGFFQPGKTYYVDITPEE